MTTAPRHSFPSLSAMLDHVQALPLASDYSAQDHWAGGTMAQAEHLAEYGWPEGAKLAADRAARIADRIIGATAENEAIVPASDVTGAAYDAGAYYSGVPECWSRPEPQPSRRAVRIVTNIIASSGVSPEAIQTRGLAVASLALALVARGYPVTIDVCQTAECATWGKTKVKGEFCTMVRVADASSGSPLDVDRIVYALAHPTMLRRHFRAVVNGVRDGSGNGIWDPSMPTPDARPDHEPTDLFLGGQHLSQANRWQDGGEAWILAEYKRQTKTEREGGK